jgi:hypothetical protein
MGAVPVWLANAAADHRRAADSRCRTSWRMTNGALSRLAGIRLRGGGELIVLSGAVLGVGDDVVVVVMRSG